MSSPHKPLQSSRSRKSEIYPGSSVKNKTRRSFRTPVQTLPLPSSSQNQNTSTKKRRSASKSFLMMTEFDTQEVTPRTAMEQLMVFDSNTRGTRSSSGLKDDNVKTRQDRTSSTTSSALKRDPSGEFKLPAIQRITRKSSIGITTPSEKMTPRTAFEDFAHNELFEEETPVTRLPPKKRTTASDPPIPATFGQVATVSSIYDSKEEIDHRKTSRKSSRRSASFDQNNSHLPDDMIGVVEAPRLSVSKEGEESDSTALSSSGRKKPFRRSFHIPYTVTLEENAPTSLQQPLPGLETSIHDNNENNVEDREEARANEHVDNSENTASDNKKSIENMNRLGPSDIATRKRDVYDLSDDSLEKSVQREHLESLEGNEGNVGELSKKIIMATPFSSHRKSASFKRYSSHFTPNVTVEKDKSIGPSGDENFDEVLSSPVAKKQKTKELSESVGNMVSSLQQSPPLSSSDLINSTTSRRSSLSRRNFSKVEKSSNSKLNNSKLTPFYSKNKTRSGRGSMQEYSDLEPLQSSTPRREKTDSSFHSTRRQGTMGSYLSKTQEKTNDLEHLERDIYDVETNEGNGELSKKSLQQSPPLSSSDLINSTSRGGSLSRRNFSKVEKSSNSKLTPFYSKNKTRSSRGSMQEYSDLEPLQSSTPRRGKTDSFFHSTRRQSTMGSYLSKTQEETNDLEGVSPIKGGNKSKLYLDVTDLTIHTQLPPTSAVSDLPISNEQQSSYSSSSSLKTPNIDMTKKKTTVSTIQRPQTQIDQSLKKIPVKKIPTSKAKSKQEKKKVERTLPRRSVKFFAQRHIGCKLSTEVLEEIENVSEKYWTNTLKALEVFALHAGRKTITEEDMVLLMKTQGMIKTTGDLHDLIREYLPLELRNDLIPCAKP